MSEINAGLLVPLIALVFIGVYFLGLWAVMRFLSYRRQRQSIADAAARSNKISH